MRNIYSKLLLGLLFVLGTVGATAQTVLINPATSGGFEGGASFPANGWTVVNSATNTWQVGAATLVSGSFGAYVSNDVGVTNAYTNTSSTVSHFYRDITFPAGETAIILKFDWRGMGEAGADDIKVFVVPTSTTPVAGTAVAAANQIGITNGYSLQAGYAKVAMIVPANYAGTTQRLVFSWRNDASAGTNPPGAIDNISLTSQAPAPLTGSYTINKDAATGGTNFNTWSEAFAQLNAHGVSGATTFTVTGTPSTVTYAEGNLLLGGAYLSGVPQSALLTTLSATNTLTFIADAGKTINMSPTGNSTTVDYIFRLMGTDYVTFDGINIVDVGTDNATRVEFGYVVGNAASNDGANNNTIKNFNCTLFTANTGQANGPFGVLVQNGTTLVSALGVTGTNGSTNNNNKIQNFTITGAKRGISFSGLAIPAFDQGNEISGASFTSATGGTWVGGSRITGGGGATSGTDWGIAIDGQKNMKIFNVQIDNFIETTAGTALSGIHFGTAASTANGADNNEIYNCVIHNLQNNLSTTSGVIGVRSSGASLVTMKMYNTAIYDLRATLATGANVIVAGLLTSTGAGSKFELYNNSINLPGALAAAGISKGFSFGLAGAVIVAKNNIIDFGTTGGGATGGVIALDFGSTSPTVIDFTNNIYNVGTPSAARRVAVYGSANRNSLIDWQSTMAVANGASDGVDQRTGYGSPGFVSGTDLTYGAANSVDNSGLPISGLSTARDILGIPRDVTAPDLGIFEGNFSAGFVDVAAPGTAITVLEPLGSVAAEIRANITDNVNTASNIITRLWYRPSPFTGAFTALAPDVAPGSANNGEYRWGTSLRALAAGTYQYYIVTRDAALNSAADPTMAPAAVSPGFTVAGDPNWNGANPFTSAGTRTFQNAGAVLAGGTYNVGTGETYATLTAVAAELSQKPISGNVIFELTTNYTGAGETFPIVFNQPAYTVAGPLTITIRPAASVASELVTAGDAGASNALILLDGMRDMTLDGRPGGTGTSRMWRITNTRDVAAATGEAIRIQNDALRNSFRYLTLQSNTNTGLGGVFSIGATFYGGQGNNYNTVDNCDIGRNPAGVTATNPTRGIAAVGGGTNAINRSNTYSNNLIHDFHNTASNPVGIFVAGEVGVTITGNSIYQTAPRSGLAAFALGIAVNGATGPGATINNNYIGGTAPLCAGTAMTVSGTTTVFYGIQINVGQYTSATTINGNTFTNWNLTSSNTTAGSIVALAINPGTGNNQFPLNITNNIIGSTTVDALTSPAIVLTSASTAAPSSFSGIFGSVSGVANITGNTIGGVRCLTSSTGTTGFIGIQVQTSGVTTNIDNNQVGSLATANNIVQSTNSNITGIAHTSTLAVSNPSISNNTVANCLFNATTAGTSQTFTGITIAGTSAVTINGNTVRDIVGNNHTTVTGISMTASGVGTVISNNTIRNFTINPQIATTAITVQGISSSASASTGRLEKNVIHSLINGSTSVTAALYGTNNQFGANWTYSNNMISLGTGVTGDIIIRGIYDFASPTVTGGMNYYYNSVSITGSAAGGVTNTFAYYNADGSGVGLKTFRNNIFSNTRTAGTGIGYAVSHSASTILPAHISSNYNDLITATSTVAQWQGTAPANNYTFAGWQGAITGDANSWNTAAPFINSATDLHLTAGAGTPLESGGTVIPTVTTDIDNQTRPGGGGTSNGGGAANDIGADDFDGTLAAPMTYVSSAVTQTNFATVATGSINQEIIGIQVVTTGSLSPLSATSFTINTNGTTAPLTDIANARIYYTGTSSTFAATNLFGTVASPNGSHVVSGTQVLAQGTNYFWVTYDIQCGATLTNPVDAECTSLTVVSAQTPSPTTVVGVRSIVAGGTVGGTKTVGSGGDFATLGAAATAINTYGISGNTVLEILAGGTTETGTVTFNQFAECAPGGFTLTIRPQATVVATITGSVASGPLIRLNGADRIIFDGSNSGGTDRSLTISNTATTAPSVIAISSLGLGAGAVNNVIKNCNITTGVATSIGYGISVGGLTPGTSGADNDNTTIQNNSITNAPVGIYANGTTSVTAGADDNLAITGNTIDYNLTTSGLASIGIQAGNSITSSISLNTISEQTSASQSPTAISLETGFISSSVTKNTITKVVTTNTGGYGGRGITVGTGTATSNLTIANNMIYGVNGSNWSGFSNSSSMGIAIGMIGNSSTISTTAGGINIYHNSVSMDGSMGTGSTSAITAALYIGSGASALDIRNNIFANTQVGTSTTQKNYAIYSAAANTAFTTINYNDYYVTNTFNTASAIPGFIGSDRVDLAGIQTGFGQNVNSIIGDPKFISPTNLHISTVVSTPVESAGIGIGAVPDDIDGNTRNVSTPDLGADEGTFIAPVGNDVQATAFIDPVNLGGKVTGATFSPTASFTNNGINNQTNVPVRFKIKGPSPATTVVYEQTGLIPTLNTLASSNFVFPSTSIAVAGTYTMEATAELVGDAVPANDMISGTFTVESPLCGTYLVGASQPSGYQNLTQAVAKLNSLGVTCAVTFELQSDYSSAGETFPITINAYPGASGTNTFTIKPAATTTPLIVGSNATSIFNLDGADYVTIDGSNAGSSSKDLTIRNTGTGPTIRLINDATLNTVKNAVVEGQNASASSGTILFSTAVSGTVGNTNNTVSNCDIRDRSDAAGVPVNAVYSSGTTAFPNANNTVTGSNIFNYTGTGVLVSATGNGNNWAVNSNNIYQTAARTTSLTGIAILSGASGNNVASNNIGGSTTGAGGSNTATTLQFNGITLSVGTASATSVQGNTIKNIRSTYSGGFTASYGIYLQAGMANIGDISGNTVGSSNAAERFEISGDSYGIRATSTSTVNLSNNTVNNMTTAPGVPTGEYYFGIYVEGTAGVFTVANNTVTNFTNGSTPDASFDTRTIGMVILATGIQTVTGNSIHDVGSTSAGAPASFNNRVWGMVVSGTAAGTTVYKNNIYNLYGSSSGAGARADVLTLLQAEGTTTLATFANNVIASGTVSPSSDRSIFGILDLAGATSVTNYYFNSVNITGTSTGGNSTYAFNRNGTSTVTITDNIFSNTRAASTGYNVAIANTNAAATGWAATASNYNDLYTIDPLTVGQWLGSALANNRDFAGFQLSQAAGTPGSGGEANSINQNPNYASATNLSLPGSSPAIGAGTPAGGIGSDYTASTRNTPPSIGAYESKVVWSGKIWLSGAYSTALGRHKNVTAAWVTARTAPSSGPDALTQPYGTLINNFGPTTVLASIYTSNDQNGTVVNGDITDWVLIDLRDATTPTTVIAQRAAFVREDGMIVDVDGVSPVSFKGLSSGNYYVDIRHRNHLSVRTALTQTVDGNAAAPTTYDFTTSLGSAKDSSTNLVNRAMMDFSGVGTGPWGLWGGNGNGNNTPVATGWKTVRAGGGANTLINDYSYLTGSTGLNGALGPITNIYHNADYNMDGSIRANGGANPLVNDYTFLVNFILGGSTTKIITQHQ